MSTIFTINKRAIDRVSDFFSKLSPKQWVVLISSVLAVVVSTWSVYHGYSVAYGDAESHLNIAKRVIHSLTPGFAQLGGIWLPLPHIFLIPFVYFDFLWRTGIAGAIVSGVAYVISSLYVFKFIHLMTKNNMAAFFGAMIFVTNPNILYLQSTPMTELPLIVFFILSSYYFVRFLKDDDNVLYLILAAFFGFCASLSRYDGWALVMMEAGLIGLLYLYKSLWPVLKTENGILGKIKKGFSSLWKNLEVFEGRLVIFSTLAFFGIALWLLWDFLILGDPLYFTHSEFSANSQQQDWDRRGELPARHNIWVSFIYYFMNTVQSGGVVISIIAMVGLVMLLKDKLANSRFLITLLLLVPFFFNITTLFMGQSVIFIPSVTPIDFEWTLFNVRYGALMIAPIAILSAYAFYRSRASAKWLTSSLVIVQMGLFFINFSPVLSFDDGVRGLSSATAKLPDAQFFLAREYDYGMVLTDDFARTLSIIRTPIPMQNVIYIGNKPYWEESFVEPQKYARWIIIQKNDTLWQNMIDKPEVEGRLYAYFNRVYTSDEILIFRRINELSTTTPPTI